MNYDKRRTNQTVLRRYGDSIHLYNQGDEWKLIIDDEKTWVEWANIKYVHQLQTFCNVLGVDLKLKL